MKEINQYLHDSRALIELPEHWCKGSPATDKSGNPVAINSETVYRFCAVGCAQQIMAQDADNPEHRQTYLDVLHLMDEYAMKQEFDSITHFNDHPSTTHRKVMKMFNTLLQETTT